MKLLGCAWVNRLPQPPVWGHDQVTPEGSSRAWGMRCSLGPSEKAEEGEVGHGRAWKARALALCPSDLMPWE